LSEYIFAMILQFLVRMRRNSVNSVSCLKSALIVVFSAISLYKGAKIVVIWQQDRRVFLHIFTAHAQKRLFRSFRSKSDPAIRSGDLDFL